MFDFEYQLKILPEKPGVYLMKNYLGEIIYVGKAKILKNRVKQYFQKSKNHTEKVKAIARLMLKEMQEAKNAPGCTACKINGIRAKYNQILLTTNFKG